MVCRSPVRVTVEEGSDDASRKHTLKNLVVLRGAPPRDDVVAAHDAFDSKPLIIPRTAAETDAIGVVAVLQCLLAHGLRLIGRIHGCAWCGGATASSIRSIRARSRTPTATASATFPGSLAGSIT